MRILFRGGHYYFTHVRWRQVMKHKRVWTMKSWLVSLFPTRAGVLPLVYVDQLPPSSRASPLALLSASPTMWPQLFEWAVWILIEGGYYFIPHRQSCGYYSRADTIRGNTVVNFMHAQMAETRLSFRPSVNAGYEANQPHDLSVPNFVMQGTLYYIQLLATPCDWSVSLSWLGCCWVTLQCHTTLLW